MRSESLNGMRRSVAYYGEAHLGDSERIYDVFERTDAPHLPHTNRHTNNLPHRNLAGLPTDLALVRLYVWNLATILVLKR